MAYDLGTAHGTIEIEYEGGREVLKAEKDMDRLKRESKDTDNELKKLGSTLGKVFGVVGKGAAFGALAVGLANAGVAAGNLAIELLGIIPNLVSIGSLAAALPAAFTALAITGGVLRASFAGFEDVISSAFDPEKADKFNEALKKLAPNAQAFAQAFKDDAVPALKDLQQGIQNAFFSNNLQQLFPRLVAGIDTLRAGLTGLAADFGGIALQLGNFATEGRTISFLDGVIEATREQVVKLSQVLPLVLNGFRDVGEVGLPLFDRLGTAIAGAAARFGDWLSDISSSGQLQSWINEGIATLKTLGGIVRNVGSILNDVFAAANATGGGLLNTIESVTGAFADFLNSAEGQSAIIGLFTAIRDLAGQLAPVVTTLAGALARALGPALSQLANEVGPVLLDVVNQLAPAFRPLASAIADVLSAVAPLVPPLAALVRLLATQLSAGLSALASELGPVIQLVGTALVGAFEALQPILDDIVANGLPLAAELGAELAAAFAPLVPAVISLAQAFANALAPALPSILAAVRQLLPAFVAFANALSGSLLQGINALIPLIPPLVNAFVQMAPVITQLLVVMLRLGAIAIQMGARLAGAAVAVATFGNTLRNVFQTIATTVVAALTSFGARAVAIFTTLPSRLAAAIRALPGTLLGIVRAALNAVATALGTGIGVWVGLMVRVPQRIGAALSQLGARILEQINRAWNTAMAATNRGANNLIRIARALPGRVRAALAALPGQIVSVLTSAWNRATSATSSGGNRVVNVVRGLPGRIRGALGNVGGLLVGAGASIINGLISGISSGIGRVMGMVSGLASRVRSAFSSALAIFSPSRVFMEFGINIDEGLILGIKKRLGAVYRQAQTLAQTALQPTIDMGSVASYVQRNIPRPPATPSSPQEPASPGSGNRYVLQIGDKVLAEFVIDTITGNPKLINKASKEGARKSAFA